MNKKNQVVMSVLGVFALVIVTVGASYAFFTYSKTGTTSSTITSGDIGFTFSEVKDVTITDAFPVADAVGAVDTANVFEFAVNATVSSTDVALTYDVTFLADNTAIVKADATEEELEAGTHVKGYFNNEHIKVNLVKNDTTWVLGGANNGVLLSTITGFTEGTTTGNGKVVTGQTITNGTTDNYKLRMWIDENVDYSNNEAGPNQGVGKYNGFTYTLKVKVDSNAVNNYQGRQ